MSKKNFVELENEQDVRDCNKSPVENADSTDEWLDPFIFSGIVCPVSKCRRGLEVQQRTEEYEVMHQVAKGLHNSDSMDNMLKTAMNAIATSKAFNFERRAGVFLTKENKNDFSLVASIGDVSKEFSKITMESLLKSSIGWDDPDSEDGLISNCCLINPRQAKIFNDVENQGLYIVPLKGHSGFIGLLILLASETTPSYERNREILLSIGGLIADAIQHFQCVEKTKKHNAKLARANKKLKKLNELKNKFLGIASHDLRNPLYLIRSYSEILKDDLYGKINGSRHTFLEKIFASSEFMQTLLDNLLDISKIESGKYDFHKNDQDLNILTKEQVEIHQFIAQKKDIEIYLDLGRIPPVNCDRDAIIQIMGNFIGNAIKFSPPNSKIYISTDRNDHAVRFSVKDEGPGICLEEQKLLFGEFQTLSPKPTGGEKSTGLGLAIVKKLVTLHGGKVGVSCEPGKGSTFFFDLPTCARKTGSMVMK